MACTPTSPKQKPAVDKVATTIPEAFLGVWDSGPKPCDEPAISDMQLLIKPTMLGDWIFLYNVKSVVIHSPTDITVLTSRVHREKPGTPFERSLHLVLAGPELTMDDGTVRGVRMRCPPELYRHGREP